MTYLWQEEYGKPYYRLQVEDKSIADKLKRRQGFRIAAISVTRPLWIFACQFNRKDGAIKTIKALTGKKPKIDSEGVISFGE